MHPTLDSIFYGLTVVKGMSYALNNPAKEMLYIPTAPGVKYKVTYITEFHRISFVCLHLL